MYQCHCWHSVYTQCNNTNGSSRQAVFKTSNQAEPGKEVKEVASFSKKGSRGSECWILDESRIKSIVLFIHHYQSPLVSGSFVARREEEEKR